MASGGLFSTKNCAGIFRCSCYIFQLNRSANSKWQFLSCVTVECSERYCLLSSSVTHTQTQTHTSTLTAASYSMARCSSLGCWLTHNTNCIKRKVIICVKKERFSFFLSLSFNTERKSLAPSQWYGGAILAIPENSPALSRNLKFQYSAHNSPSLFHLRYQGLRYLHKCIHVDLDHFTNSNADVSFGIRQSIWNKLLDYFVVTADLCIATPCLCIIISVVVVHTKLVGAKQVNTNHSLEITVQYSRTPLIQTLFIRITNYPDRLGPADKFVENFKKTNLP